MSKEKATIIFFSVIIVFLILGIISESDSAHKKGYNEGYESGYELGYEDGYTACMNDYDIE